MEHHPQTKAERNNLHRNTDEKKRSIRNTWEFLKHHAEHNFKKLNPTRRQSKGALGEQEQINNLNEEK